jgi:anti-sigma B factor antagonist
MMDQMVDLELRRQGRIALAIVAGEIDMSNASSVRQRISEFVTPDDDAVVIDLGSLSFIDSAGLHAVVELGTLLAERRQRLLLSVAPGSHVERAVEIVGMVGTVPVYPGRDAAIGAARESAVEPRPISPTDRT